jgi:hypothetical protein
MDMDGLQHDINNIVWFPPAGVPLFLAINYHLTISHHHLN